MMRFRWREDGGRRLAFGVLAVPLAGMLVLGSACLAHGQKVSVNPPALRWPASRGKQVRYDVRLSQDAAFPDGSTVYGRGLRWALFNPHEELAAGAWYWQYRAVERAGKEAAWSEVFRFEVDPGARRSVTPPAAQVLAACPKTHPRVLITSDELPAFRQRVKGSPELRQFVRYAEQYVGGKLPGRDEALTTEKGATAYESRNFAKWASKAYAGRLVGSITWLVPAYLATGDARFGREAVRRAMYVADLDPDGATAPNVSDFADGSCMRAMALAYDSCFDLLTEEQRARLREAMTARASRFFERQVNNLESRVFSAHVWQHILAEFAEVALATLGEVPEAELWASYVYEVWVGKVPLLGGDDGGWANGVGYFGSNIETLLALPSRFGGLAGVDLFDHPWYRNVIYWHLYSWPPGSASDGFGDGCEREGRPSASRAFFLEALGRKFADPYALWYAKEAMGDRAPGSGLSSMLMWRRLRWDAPQRPVEPKPPDDLPQARAFPDVGIVSMHTDLADAFQDLMIGFRSSPYGSFNHMHACQNSFNLLFGGERLFASSGYYIAYGDAHFTGWYKHTRGHNSVLIDGQGQAFGPEGYGSIVRFLHGRQISYCLGDASRAYGDAGLTKFRRHLALLRPGTVVIYDELEADHSAQWSWLLHSKREITADERLRRLTAAVGTARAQVDLLGSSPLGIAADHRFDPPAVNWRKRKSGGQVIEYPDQWHATVAPTEPSPRARFLAVIQVRAADDPSPLADPEVEEQGWMRVGNWRIQAELDTGKSPSLVIKRADDRAVLAADVPSILLGSKPYDVPLPGAILVEPAEGIVGRCGDLPSRSAADLLYGPR